MLKSINNLKLSQWIYNNFQSLSDRPYQRRMLMVGCLFLISGYFTGSIAYSEQLLFHNYACDSFRYLVCRSKIAWTALIEGYERWAIYAANRLAKELGVKIALIIDDTLVEKDHRSENLAVGGKRAKKSGFSFLTAVSVIDHITIPLIPQLCMRESVCQKFGIDYVSKVDKAIQSLERWINIGLDVSNSVVMVDSWYSSNKMINYCQSIPGLKYVLGIKSNRNIDKSPVENLKYGFRHLKSNNISKKEYDFYFYLRRGKLNKVKEEVNVLISKRENRRTKDTSWRYFVTNLDDELAVFNWVRTRWQIETFHQIFKHRFKPESWRVFGVERLSHLAAMVTIAIGYAVKYFIDQHRMYKYSLERLLNQNILAESLSFIRAILISNEAMVKSFIQSKT